MSTHNKRILTVTLTQTRVFQLATQSDDIHQHHFTTISQNQVR